MAGERLRSCDALSRACEPGVISKIVLKESPVVEALVAFMPPYVRNDQELFPTPIMQYLELLTYDLDTTIFNLDFKGRRVGNTSLRTYALDYTPALR